MLVCFTTAFHSASILILSSFANVDPGSNNRYQSADLLQQLVSKLKVNEGLYVKERRIHFTTKDWYVYSEDPGEIKTKPIEVSGNREAPIHELWIWLNGQILAADTRL